MKISKKIKAFLLRNEKWLPVVDESGMVYGKIAQSQSLLMENEYLHPVVRIALIHKGKIFLCGEENVDYPFERPVFFRETLDEAVAKTFESSGSELSPNCNYVFHYVHRDEKLQRLVYFYICNMRDAVLPEMLRLKTGKWWTGKQIKENLKSGLFSAFFENEFAFLDSTVLAVE